MSEEVQTIQNQPADPDVVTVPMPPIVKQVAKVAGAVVVEWVFSTLYVSVGMALVATAYNIPAQEWGNLPLLQNGILWGAIPMMALRFASTWAVGRIIQTAKRK